MRRPSQRNALSLLFAALALGFAAIAVAAVRADRWVIAVAAGVLGVWMGGLAAQAFRR